MKKYILSFCVVISFFLFYPLIKVQAFAKINIDHIMFDSNRQFNLFTKKILSENNCFLKEKINYGENKGKETHHPLKPDIIADIDPNISASDWDKIEHNLNFNFEFDFGLFNRHFDLMLSIQKRNNNNLFIQFIQSSYNLHKEDSELSGDDRVKKRLEIAELFLENMKKTKVKGTLDHDEKIITSEGRFDRHSFNKMYEFNKNEITGFSIKSDPAFYDLVVYTFYCE